MTGICILAEQLPGGPRLPGGGSNGAQATQRPADSAVIIRAQTAAGHDGLPELLLRLRYPNGGEGTVTVDNDTGVRLLNICGVDSIEGLVGQPWNRLLQAAGSGAVPAR
jgi:hypothetical protein